MNEPLPEDDLETLFQRQRTADHERAPGFHAMRTQALTSAQPSRPAHRVWSWALAGSVAVAVAVAAVTLLHQPTKPPLAAQETVIRQLDQIDTALQKSLAAQDDLTAWQSPTDFLLNPTHNESTP